MPQKKKPARIYLRERPGRSSVYVIKDGGKEVSLGTADFDQATAALEQYTYAPVRYRPMIAENDMRAAARRMMRGVRERSRVNKLENDLDEKWLMMRLVEQDFRCALSGIKFSLEPSDRGRRSPFAASPDRIKNTRGYTRDNVRLVTIMVNLALGDFSDSEFFAMCEGVVKTKSGGSIEGSPQFEAGADPQIAEK